MLKSVIFVIFFIQLMPSGSLFAQELPPSPSSVPKNMMEKLSMISGQWKARTDFTNDDGKTWQQGGEKLVEFSYKQRGLLLEELPIEIDNKGFHMQTYISYDQYRQVFRKAAIDDVWGIMDLYQGNIIDDQLVLDNLSAGTFFPVQTGVWRGFRLTLELKSDNRWLLVDKTDDKGKTWQPAFRVFYQKVI